MVALPSHLAQHRQNTHNAHFFNRLGQLLSIRCFLLLILSSVAISQVSYYGRIFKELGGGKSFHLKRKTKHHKHHHHYRHHNVTPVAVISASTRTHGEDKGYSLRSTSYAYVMEMQLGTPPQKLEFLVDTGSANMAIAGPACKDQHNVKCKIDNFYYPSKSETSVALGRPVETEYGKGSWSGHVYRDVVSFPGGPTTIAEFAVIDREKEFFLKNSVNEGILGLAYKSLAAENVEPLYDQLVHDRKLPDIFAMSLCNGNGRLWLDEPDDEAFHRPIHWTRIIHRAWYTVRMTGIDVGGRSLGLSPYSYPPAIVDSGTTDILLEPEIYIAVIAMLKRHGPPVDERFWNNYCVETDPFKWPYITIYLKDMRGGSFALTVLGKHYVRKQDQFYCLSIGAKQFGAVLGEVTMEGNVVIFDRANHRIGFASSNLTDIESGAPCGNPSNINTTVAGRLYDFCHAPFMPRVSCHRHCLRCTKHGGAWCPRGRIFVWINGVKSALDASAGFCWIGGVFGFEVPRFQTYLPGHGSVEFELQCYSILPMYRQCILRGEWLFAIIVVVVFASTILCMCICCRRVYEADTREPYPLFYDGQKEQYPIYDPRYGRRR